MSKEFKFIDHFEIKIKCKCVRCIILKRIIKAVLEEYYKASCRFGSFNSAHEGFAVLKEEIDELWEAVKLKQNNPIRRLSLNEEAIQSTAMGLRFIYDICFKDFTKLYKRQGV